MSSPCTDTKKHEISDLPPEVLPVIFKHLSANERKPVKLVCKSWLESCNTASLLKDEVLTCLDIYKLSDTYELLDKSERKFLNLKFENVSFRQDGSFWRKNGLRIQSLDFIDCQFYDGNLEEIIICCENLFHLSFTYTANFQYIIDDMNSLPPIKDVETVAAKSIVRENLGSLEIEIINSNWMRLSDHIIHQLLLIFPNVKILKIMSDFSPFQDVCMNLSELPDRYRVTMSPVVNYLIASTEKIEKLTLDFPSANFSVNSLRCILETVSSLKRLTELCIGTRNTATIEDIGTFLYSKQLKSLEFSIDMSDLDLTYFLSQLLHSCSKLQFLKVYLPCTSFTATKPFYDLLISSSLKSIVVTVGDICIEDYFADYLSIQNNSMVLPSLSVCFGSGYPLENILPLLQYYQSLDHFEVDSVSYDVLQCLLKYQKKLRSLKIFSANCFDYFDIAPGGLTFNELRVIECLELTYPPVVDLFLSTLLPDPILAKLKYLRIDVADTNSKLFSTNLLRSANAMPFLEGLCVHDASNASMPFDDVVELCRKLRRLRYFYFNGSWSVNDGDLTEEHFHKLFSSCPSLRVVAYFGSKGMTYFFDTIKKKVVLKQSGPTYHLGRPRIGDFTVSWLKF